MLLVNLFGHSAYAKCVGSQVNLDIPGESYCHSTGLPTTPATGTELQLILQIVFATLAATAVLFIIIGGMRYSISGGDPEAMSKAKGTIIYAIVGLIVALFAEGIVSFALGFIG